MTSKHRRHSARGAGAKDQVMQTSQKLSNVAFVVVLFALLGYLARVKMGEWAGGRASQSAGTVSTAAGLV